MSRNKEKRHAVETGILWNNVAAAIQAAGWETDPEDETQELRLVYLGSVTGLSPSGKFYMPFSSSNLGLCPSCHGTGRVTLQVPARRAKKAKRRLAALKRKGDRIMDSSTTATGIRRFNVGYANAMREQLKPLATGEASCRKCRGYGRHEAAADERYWELLDEQAEAHDMFIWRNEDDGVYAAQSRDRDDADC